LSQGIAALPAPKAMNYFNGKWAPRGKNVAELAAWMTKEGLIFAPAAPGDEPTYNALYLALSTYEADLASASR
jgi:hypothetical protein